MPIGSLNPENISTGWAPAEQFRAPDLGAVLQNRLAEQALMQKSISDAIKNRQAQQEAQQYGQALQNAGLVYPGDVSRLNSAQLTQLAQLTGDNTQDTDEDASKQAIANYHNAAANSLWTYPGGKGTSGVDYSEHPVGDQWQDENGVRWYMTRTGPREQRYDQPSNVKTQTQNQQLMEESRLQQRQSQLDMARALQEQLDRNANRPNNPFASEAEYQSNKQKLQDIQRQRTMPHADQPNTDTGDQTDPTDQTGQTNQTQPSGGGVTPPAGQDPAKRQRAIQILQNSTPPQPTTEANIAHVVAQL